MSITEKQAEVQPLIRNESLQASLSASSLCRPARAGTVKAGDGDASATIYYEVYSSRRAARKDGSRSVERVIMIMGLAASCAGWRAQLQELAGEVVDAVRERNAELCSVDLDICVFDNRGVGRSSSPPDPKAHYSTAIMAQDTLALLDHLGWASAHVVGFSMGGMVAMKLASAAPGRVDSLAVLSATAGGWQSVPLRRWRGVKYTLRLLLADTVEKRAAVDLKFHFSKRTLRAVVPGSNRTRHQLLLEEYVQTARSGAPQPAHGQRGQLTAVWNHRLSDAEVSSIQGGHFPIWFMHGRHDVVALARFAEQLAHRLGAPCLVVDGAHFIPRDCGHEVNVLLGAIFSRKIKPFVQQSMWIEEHPPTSLSGGGADGDGSDAAAAAPGSSSSSSQQRGRDYSRSADPAVRDGSAADLGTSVSSPSARRQGVAVSVSAQGQGASPKASAAAAGGSASLKGSSGSSTTSNKRSGSLSTEGGSPCAADGAGVPPAAAGLASLITSGSAAAAAAAKAKVA